MSRWHGCDCARERMRAITMCLSANVANAYWNRDNRQTNMDRNDADNHDPNNCASFAVSDYDESDRFQPPSCLPTS